MLKALTFLLSLVPAAYIGVQIYLLQSGAENILGADPGKEVVTYLGQWSLRFLLLTLAVTPVRRLSGWQRIREVRRMLGLFTFFYASLHLGGYLLLLLELDFQGLGADLIKRPFITAGFAAWLLLVPLALTSNALSMRRLKRNWLRLHRLVYLAVALGILHLIWLSKSSFLEAMIYGGVAALLLSFRVVEPLSRLFRKGLNRGPEIPASFNRQD